MGSMYILSGDSGTWTDNNVVEIMKKSQREYNKRFMNKKQESKISDMLRRSIQNKLINEQNEKIGANITIDKGDYHGPLGISDIENPSKYKCYLCGKELGKYSRIQVDKYNSRCVGGCFVIDNTKNWREPYDIMIGKLIKQKVELEQENSNLKEELKQKTNNRDHYKDRYEVMARERKLYKDKYENSIIENNKLNEKLDVYRNILGTDKIDGMMDIITKLKSISKKD